MEIEISLIDWEKAIPIRHQVLWPEKAPEFCYVDGDKDAWHFGAYVGNKLVCVASVYQKDKQARLRKFATLENYQNKGIGSQVLKFIVETIKQHGITNFWCDARESATGFYEKFGLKAEGSRFYKSDVSYYKMAMTITT